VVGKKVPARRQIGAVVLHQRLIDLIAMHVPIRQRAP
jgi:hypothetical protein